MVTRQPLIPRFLSVCEGAVVARKPFKPPCLDGYSDHSEELHRRLSARKRFVPWGSSRPVLVPVTNKVEIQCTIEQETIEPSPPLPPGTEPLILWQSEMSMEASEHVSSITVDPLLVRYLRPHQRYFRFVSCMFFHYLVLVFL